MTNHRRAEISEMPPGESLALLERNHVGRLAFTLHDRVDIEPMSYVHDDGWLYMRTSLGTKLETVHHHPFVAFEVGEIEGRFDWRSVVVHGTIYFLDPMHGDRTAYERAVAVLRSLDPGAFTGEDAAPHRQSPFRIYANEISGRRSRFGS